MDHAQHPMERAASADGWTAHKLGVHPLLIMGRIGVKNKYINKRAFPVTINLMASSSS